jgi:tripartite-type tricarboxylate transporter receptor subunit TctC
VIALVSGETQCQVAAIGELIQHIKTNRVRALGVTALKRVAELPDVPTIADTIRGYESSTWVSVYAPAGTPKAIVDRFNAEFGKALSDPDVAAKLSAQTLYPAHRSPEVLDKRLKADHEMIGTLFRQLGVKLD